MTDVELSLGARLALESRQVAGGASHEEADEMAERLCKRISDVHDDIMAGLLAAEAAEAARLQSEDAKCKM